jgi:hypothetical protein
MKKEIKLVEGEDLERLRNKFTKSNKKFSQTNYIKALTKENTELKEKLFKCMYILENVLRNSGGTDGYKN